MLQLMDVSGQQIDTVVLPLPFQLSGPMLAVGGYLYAATGFGHRIARISKADATTRMIAGDSASDGLLLNNITGLASDGTKLYASDDHGLTTITATTRTYAAAPSGPRIDTASVNTYATLSQEAQGLAVLAGYAYTNAGNQIVSCGGRTRS